MNVEEYRDWIADHSKTLEADNGWFIVELDLPDEPKLADQGDSEREAVKVLAKRYRKYADRHKDDNYLENKIQETT